MVSPKLKFRSRRFAVLASLALVTVVTILGLFATPPKPVLRWLVTATAPLLLEGNQSAASGVRGTAARLARVYANVGVATHLARPAIERGGADEAILARLMESAREIVLNPRTPEESRYPIQFWPAVFSGVGYCDQANALVSRMAAHHFPKAEIFALYDATGWSPHTIGRVWSDQRQDWLYFDAFYAEPVMFTVDAGGKKRFLRSPEVEPRPDRYRAPDGIYDLPGRTLASFPSTFGGYLFDRVLARVTGGGASPDDAATAASTVAVPATTAPRQNAEGRHAAPRRDALVFENVVRAYAEARVAHVLDGRAAYGSIAGMRQQAERDDRAAEIANAANRFCASLR